MAFFFGPGFTRRVIVGFCVSLGIAHERPKWIALGIFPSLRIF
jgi:hypothetical protein